MEITKELLGSRLNQLMSERESLEQQIVQANANLAAYNGAIEDCEYWLKKMDEKEKKQKSKKNKKDLAGG